MSERAIETLVRGVCVVKGHVLLCRGRGSAISYLPGGHIEFHERAATALAREVEEELGLIARVGRFLGGVEHTFIQKGRRHAELNLVFAMRVPGLKPEHVPPSREDWIGFEWCPLNRLARARLEPAVLCRALPRWLAGGGAGWASTRTGWQK